MFVDRTTRRHQRKRKFVKRARRDFEVFVVMVVAWGSCYG
jgi:hypothetical protein